MLSFWIIAAGVVFIAVVKTTVFVANASGFICKTLLPFTGSSLEVISHFFKPHGVSPYNIFYHCMVIFGDFTPRLIACDDYLNLFCGWFSY